MCKHILINNFNVDNDFKYIDKFSSMTSDRDGYGAIIRTDQNGFITLKSLNLASFYLKLGELTRLKNIRDLVIHHRTSTNGSGLDYSHPFEYQGNYLTHNGVVSVPDKHDTKTTNDSEQLLHHLIKTNYDTKVIQGYFSCFILNKDTTTVLVDDTAPMWTDGRVYSSHRLFDEFEAMALTRLVIDPQGNRHSFPIEVTKTSYGSDKAYLSLGQSWRDYDAGDSMDRDIPSGGRSAYWFSQCDVFLRYVTPDDEYLIATAGSDKARYKLIKSMARAWDMELSKEDMRELMEYFKGNYYKLA